MELSVIAAAVIGGANLTGGSGTILGAVVGAALIEIIRNSLTCGGLRQPAQQPPELGRVISIEGPGAPELS